MCHKFLHCRLSKAFFFSFNSGGTLKQTKPLHAATHRLKQQGKRCHLCTETYSAGRLVFLPLKTLMCTMLACVGWMDLLPRKVLSERFHIEALFCKSLKERNESAAHTQSHAQQGSRHTVGSYSMGLYVCFIVWLPIIWI